MWALRSSPEGCVRVLMPPYSIKPILAALLMQSCRMAIVRRAAGGPQLARHEGCGAA